MEDYQSSLQEGKNDYMKFKELVEDSLSGTSDLKSREGVFPHGDGMEHFIIKSVIYKLLHEKGNKVLTELLLPGGYFVDVLDVSNFVIYEVETDLDEETRQSKVNKYLSTYSRVGDFISEIVFIDVDKVPSDISDMKDHLESKLQVEGD